MNESAGAIASYHEVHVILDGTLDQPVTGYTDGSRWNGFATPVFDLDTATQVMQAVNTANDGIDDQISVSFEANRDAFLIQDPNYPDDDPEMVQGHDIVIDGSEKHVYALGTRSWTWEQWEQNT